MPDIAVRKLRAQRQRHGPLGNPLRIGKITALVTRYLAIKGMKVEGGIMYACSYPSLEHLQHESVTAGLYGVNI